MKTIATIKLIKSLSVGEKRQFKMDTKKQQGDRAFIYLFDLIDKCRPDNISAVWQMFKKKYPNASIDSSLAYLFQVVTDVLIRHKVQSDPSFAITNSLMKITLFRQRNLPGQAQRELKTAQALVSNTENLFLKYVVRRAQLDFFAESNFKAVSEKRLVMEQQTAREILSEIKHIQEFHSIYEILRFRVESFADDKTNEERKKQLDDLLFNELAIMNQKTKHSNTSQKLHLLFQSFYFNHTGQHQSALKTFYALNMLYEKTLPDLSTPPMEYFSVLDGILDSLVAIKDMKGIAYFIAKLRSLLALENPDYFNLLVKKTILLYEVRLCCLANDWNKAIDTITSAPQGLTKRSFVMSDKKEAELIFFLALPFFMQKNYRKCAKYLKENIVSKDVNFSLMVVRASRLLNILTIFHQKDYEYLTYEIRSYKRFFAAQRELLPIELFIFKLLSHLLSDKPRHRTKKTQLRLSETIYSLGHSSREKLLLNHFDFISWAKEKLQ